MLYSDIVRANDLTLWVVWLDMLKCLILPRGAAVLIVWLCVRMRASLAAVSRVHRQLTKIEKKTMDARVRGREYTIYALCAGVALVFHLYPTAAAARFGERNTLRRRRRWGFAPRASSICAAKAPLSRLSSRC